jgi:hypothetical protein
MPRPEIDKRRSLVAEMRAQVQWRREIAKMLHDTAEKSRGLLAVRLDLLSGRVGKADGAHPRQRPSARRHARRRS